MGRCSGGSRFPLHTLKLQPAAAVGVLTSGSSPCRPSLRQSMSQGHPARVLLQSPAESPILDAVPHRPLRPKGVCVCVRRGSLLEPRAQATSRRCSSASRSTGRTPAAWGWQTRGTPWMTPTSMRRRAPRTDAHPDSVLMIQAQIHVVRLQVCAQRSALVNEPSRCGRNVYQLNRPMHI